MKFLKIPLFLFILLIIPFKNAYASSVVAHELGSFYAGQDIEAIDVDSDGDIDIMASAYAAGGGLYWYENDGTATFTKHNIHTSSSYDYMHLDAGDIDGDSDIDVIVSERDGYVYLYTNDGSENFSRTTVASGLYDPQKIKMGDLDDDGDIDIIVPNGAYTSTWVGNIRWYENNGAESFTSRYVDTNQPDGYAGDFGDMDEDGDTDIIAAGNTWGNVSKYISNGGTPPSFSETYVGSGSQDLEILDIDEDGDLDFVTVGWYYIRWYENDGTASFTTHTISSDIGNGTSIYVDDIDGDGDYDLLVPESSGGVSWWANDGSFNFTQNTVTNYSSSTTRFGAIADVDGGGDKEVICFGASNTLYWYEIVMDSTAPSIDTLSPADDSIGVSIDSNLTITFDEVVDAESGNITIYKSDDTEIEQFDVTSDISGSGTDTITINPGSDFLLETEYYVQIDATAFDDAAGNSFPGIADTTTWTFTTDENPPVISDISSTGITDTGSTITWTTDAQASSQVEYGLTSALAASVTTTETDLAPRVTSHSVDLSSLVACTTYYYQVKSTRATSTQATGSIQNFTTTGCNSDSSISNSSAGEAAVDIAAGGTQELDIGDGRGVLVSIPIGYHDTDSFFQIMQLDDSTVLADVPAPDGYQVIEGFIYQFRALEGVTSIVENFDEDLTITITYSDDDISEIIESSLQIYYNDGSTWTALEDCVVDTDANTVTCTTDHFSSYGLFGELPETTTSGVSPLMLQNNLIETEKQPEPEQSQNPDPEPETKTETETLETGRNCVDLNEIDWSYSIINELVSSNRYPTLNTSQGIYCRPKLKVTRGEAIKWIVEVHYSKELEKFDINSIESLPFSDIKRDNLYTPHIIIAHKYGLIDGYSDGEFKPAKTINRAELLKILINEYRGYKETSSITSTLKEKAPEKDPIILFRDVHSEKEWYYEYLYYAASQNIIIGRELLIGDIKVRNADMDAPILYEEFAKILFMLIDK